MNTRGLLLLGVGLWLVLSWRTGPPTGDFANYFTAAVLWLEGDPLTQIYDYRWFTAQSARLGFGDRLVGFAVLTPPSALLAVPLTVLSPVSAAWAWWAGQVGLGLLLASLLAWGRQRAAWVGMAALLVGWPVLRSHLIQGQFHLPVAVCLAGGLWCWRVRRDGLAGVLLGLAIGLKVHAWPVLLIAVLARRGTTLAAAMGTLLLGGLISVALLGWPVHEHWLHEIAPAAARGQFVHPWHPAFQSLSAGLHRVWLPHPGLNPTVFAERPALVAAVLAGFQPLIVGLTAAGGLSWSRLSEPDRDRLLAAAAAAAMVSGPILSHYHLVLLLPVVVWAADALVRDGRAFRAGAVVVLAAAAAWWPVSSVESESAAVWLLAALPRLWLLLALWVLMMPWSRDRTTRIGRAVVLGLVGMLMVFAAPSGPDPDGARPTDAPEFPLISAELLRTEDGSLWWSGLTSHRGDLPGQGWVGYRLKPGASIPEIVASSPTAHTWSPQVAGPDSVEWSSDSLPQASQVRPGPDGSTLLTIQREGQSDIALRRPDGTLTPVTQSPAHDTDPVWDPDTGRIWFLSDRGVGVRALRLWSVSDTTPRSE